MINTLKYVILLYLLNINYCCQSIMHVFIMYHSFLIQAHGAIKYIVNMWDNVGFCSNICYHFAKNIAFLYHNNIYHLCISQYCYHEILYHNNILLYHLSRLSWQSLVSKHSRYAVQHKSLMGESFDKLRMANVHYFPL